MGLLFFLVTLRATLERRRPTKQLGMCSPDGQAQAPPWHVLPPSHVLLHLPQWLVLVSAVSQPGPVASQSP